MVRAIVFAISVVVVSQAHAIGYPDFVDDLVMVRSKEVGRLSQPVRARAVDSGPDAGIAKAIRELRAVSTTLYLERPRGEEGARLRAERDRVEKYLADHFSDNFVLANESERARASKQRISCEAGERLALNLSSSQNQHVCLNVGNLITRIFHLESIIPFKTIVERDHEGRPLRVISTLADGKLWTESSFLPNGQVQTTDYHEPGVAPPGTLPNHGGSR